MLIIGIDPGISGAICFFENGKIIDVVEMPTMTEGKLSKWLKKDPKTINMTSGMNGKPYLNEIPQIKFNITH